MGKPSPAGRSASLNTPIRKPGSTFIPAPRSAKASSSIMGRASSSARLRSSVEMSGSTRRSRSARNASKPTVTGPCARIIRAIRSLRTTWSFTPARRSSDGSRSAEGRRSAAMCGLPRAFRGTAMSRRPSRGTNRSTTAREFDHDLAIFCSKPLERSAGRPWTPETPARRNRHFGRFGFRYPGSERQVAL